MNSQHLTNEEINAIFGVQYQTVENTGAAWTALIREHLGNAENLKVLDAGCGSGFLSILLARLGYQVIALDQSSTALEKARENARKFGVLDQIEFCHGNAAETNMDTESFDAILSRNATTLFLEPVIAYKEWFRLLKQGGMILNFDANWLSPLWSDDHAAAFLADEKELRKDVADYTDIYNDRYALFRLSQCPLAFQQRPQWDKDICREIGFQVVSSFDMTDSEMLPPVLAKRFRSIPTFLFKAIK